MILRVSGSCKFPKASIHSSELVAYGSGRLYPPHACPASPSGSAWTSGRAFGVGGLADVGRGKVSDSSISLDERDTGFDGAVDTWARVFPKVVRFGFLAFYQLVPPIGCSADLGRVADSPLLFFRERLCKIARNLRRIFWGTVVSS